MVARRIAALGGIALLAGCAAHRPRPETASPTSPADRPLPPAGAAPGLDVPDPDALTINSGVGSEEALWHVRAALNVAALSCARQPGGPELVRRYNALLSDRKPVLAAAYADEAGRRAQADLDRHMTMLYNFFAQPPAQVAFCAAAATVAERAAAMPAAGLSAFAPDALRALEAPITGYYRAYARYRQALAAWQARPAATVAAAAGAPEPRPPRRTAAGVSSTRIAAAWRIQIGAFTGKDAAKAAWGRAQARVPSLAVYRAHYQKVPDSPLVRVQVGKAGDRASALRLCAAAAAGGFDCFPVAR